jgi:hypothetical protein
MPPEQRKAKASALKMALAFVLRRVRRRKNAVKKMQNMLS